ncbi:MAG: SPFH domain-containing protein [Candidatus Helarchaeota archaeon]
MNELIKIMNKKIGISKDKIVSWRHETFNDVDINEKHLRRKITWKIPDINNPRYSNIKKIDYFSVKDYESAVFLNKGEIIDILKGGLYQLVKSAKVEGTEIVWIDSREIQLPFGIALNSNLLRTSDGFQLGMFFYITLKISDARKFVSKISGASIFTGEDLRNSVKNIIEIALSDIINSYRLIDLPNISQNKLAAEVMVNIYDQLYERGIKVIGFGPVRFNYSVEAKSVIELPKRDVIRTTIKVDTIKELSTQDEIEKIKLEILKRKLKRERELELEKRQKLITEMETEHILEEYNKKHKLKISELEMENAKIEGKKLELESKAKATSTYYEKKLPAQAELELDQFKKQIEIQENISELKAKTESEINLLKSESEAFKMKRLSEAEARVKEKLADIDISKLEIEKELARHPDSKLIVSNKYEKLSSNKSKIRILRNKLNQYEKELDDIRNKMDELYRDLKNKKISEAIYKTRFNFLIEEKKKLEDKIEKILSNYEKN